MTEKMPTPEELVEWRKQFDERMMTSAICEYCPEEFGRLLDALVARDEQHAAEVRAKVEKAIKKIEKLSEGPCPTDKSIGLDDARDILRRFFPKEPK